MSSREQLELADLRRGDSRAWRLVHEKIRRAAASFRSALGEEWEDAVQEAEIRLLRALRSDAFVDQGLRTFVWRVTRNTCRDQLRRRRLRSAVPLEAVVEPRAGRGWSPMTAVVRAEQRLRLSWLGRVLPEECRWLLHRLRQGRSYSDLAQELGISPGAVRVRAHRCRRRARERFARMTSPVVGTAQRLFVERGYAATSLGAVAEAAGTTVAEIEKLCGDKPGLLWAVGERILTGVDGVSLEEIDFTRPMRETDDPRRRVFLATGLTAKMFERGIADFESLVFEAARQEARLHGLPRRMDRLKAWIGRSLVEELTRGLNLRRGTSLEALAKAAVEIDSVDNYRRLARERGWAPEEIRRWKQREIERLVLL